MSKQELITMSNAPSRLKLAIQRFHNASKSQVADNPITSVSIEKFEDDYQPKQLGLLYDSFLKVSIDLSKNIGVKLEETYSLVENSSLKQTPLTFDLKVVFVDPRLPMLIVSIS